MPLSQLQHRRTHNLLLIRKLLECRENASPFTLVLDSLEQSGRPLLRTLIAGAKNSRVKVLFVSSETIRSLHGVDAFIQAHASSLDHLRGEISKQITGTSQRHLIIFDSINVPLCWPNASHELPTFLSSLISPSTSIAAVYHLDSPVQHEPAAYTPPALTLLKYLATAILSTHSLPHVVAAKAARSRSLAPPVHGFTEEKEGVIAGLGCNDARGIVVEMEYRRKSGRAVHEVYFIASGSGTAKDGSVPTSGGVVLLDDLTAYKSADEQESDLREEMPEGGGDAANTFNLSLTAKQRADREGVVLPYFDAQSSGGVGEGGRILYDMGVEDDFDEEEDEI